MRVGNAFIALAALAAGLATTGVGVSPALARSADTVLVGYSDLNLASAAGRRALDSRIAVAVDSVCSAGESLDIRSNSLSRACRDEAFAAAQPQRDAAVVGRRTGSVRVSTAAN